MKITKEQINELPQLDRIEIRQKLKYYHDRTNFSFFATCFLIIVESPVFASIFFMITFYNLIKEIVDRHSLEKDYFEVKVKRNVRRVKKK